jgi:hypothetical protein
MSAEVHAAGPDVFNVLPFFSSKHLSLRELACLAASSKQLKQICCAVAKQDAFGLLAAELEAAGKAATAVAKAEADLAAAAPCWYNDDADNDDWMHCSNPPVASKKAKWIEMTKQAARRQRQLVKQHKQAVAWLLRASPAVAAAAGAAECLLTIPAVPLHIAKMLVAVGVRISYAQLLAAAHSMVAGVEVWVQAQQQLDVQTDMPQAALHICGESYDDTVGINAQ